MKGETETDSAIRFKSYFKYNAKENEFQDLPTDLYDFLRVYEGTIQPIRDNLEPDKYYIIEISIKSTR